MHLAVVELGQVLFRDTSFSRDGQTSCQSCHDPARAYADPRSRSQGTDHRSGTRNAPSLVGIGNDVAFFWDGRRTRLEDAVLDPFTNPVELGLSSKSELLDKLRHERKLSVKFRAAFPDDPVSPTVVQVSEALSEFVRSLRSEVSVYDRAQRDHMALAGEAEHGRQLFESVAGCNDCHTMVNARFTDDKYHHSNIGVEAQDQGLPKLAKMVALQNLEGSILGSRILADPEWSSLGRFVVSHRPRDIAAFRTPSLRNVAVTAPYMHDGSIPSLQEAVDHEIYYRGLSSGRVTNLSQAERKAIVAFLETLTDENYRSSTH